MIEEENRHGISKKNFFSINGSALYGEISSEEGTGNHCSGSKIIFSDPDAASNVVVNFGSKPGSEFGSGRLFFKDTQT